MSECISLVYKDFLKALERSSLQKQAVSSHNATNTLKIQHALSSSSAIRSLDRSAKRRKMKNGMKKSRMKKNSAVIIKAEADRLKTSRDVKDNGNDSNGQMASFKTSELMYCLAH